MTSFSTTEALLQDLVSNLKSAKNPTEYLYSKLRERAHFTYTTTEEKNDEKPHRGIVGGLPQICATESDVDVSDQREEGVPQPQPAGMNDDHDYEHCSLDSDVVDELLPLLKKENVFGRQAEKERLLSLLLSPDPQQPQLSVIPIVGKDGIGKTTLARQIYEDPTVQDHFELKAWVKIDGQQRKHHQLFDIARKLLKSAMGMLCTFNNLVEMHEMVVDTLLSHRSLIVLDDFDFMEDEQWQNLKDTWFRFVGVGSKVVITARHCKVEGSAPFYVGELSQHDSWSLYTSLAFSLSESKEREEEEDDDDDASKLLAGRCQGVPLSLKLLGSLMRFERSCSSYLMERIIAAASFEDDVDSFILLLSVLSLPEDLFNCFAYCAIFPYGYVLEKEKLIKIWIANDVVKPSMGMSLEVEEIGEAYFHQLLCRSFFTEISCNDSGEIVEAQMAKVVHELARIIAQVVLRDKVAYAFGVDANSLVLSMAMPFQESHYNPKHLHILLSFPPKTPHPLPLHTQSFIELKRLRSLDLSKSGIRNLSKHVCMLRKLSYLNLSHTPLTNLPKSFTTLTRLQTLDLSRCYYLKALPKKTSNLSKLRHLDLSHCNSLTRTPSGIGRLSSLITMPLYVLGERDSKCASLKELSKLKKLRGLLRITHLENVKEISEAQAADLKQKKLHHLGLCWSHRSHECGKVLEFLEPNPELRVLELRGYEGSRFPSWMPNLGCLVKLLINDCRFSMLTKLGELQLLKDLELRDLVNIISIGQEFYGRGCGDVFPSLEKLKIHNMPNLKSWSNDDHSASKVFPKLKKLSIRGCPRLQYFPSQPSVTELVVWGSHGDILPWVTRTKSLSSIVVNDMDVKESLKGSSSLNSVKKLILVRSTDLDVLESCHINKFASLQHLRILHCLNLRHINFSRLGSLEKLDVVDCQNLERIDIITKEFAPTEMMIEDCPRITTVNITTYSGYPSSLRKLVVRNCPKFIISPHKMDELQGLEFLFITGYTVLG